MRKSSASIEEQWAAGRLGEGSLTEWALQDCVLDTVLHVPLVSLCKCSSHSCKSWLVLQDTVMRSIMFPAAVVKQLVKQLTLAGLAQGDVQNLDSTQYKSKEEKDWH